MSLKYTAFSILFFFIVIFLGLKNYDTWTRPLEISPGKKVEKKTERKTVAPPVTADAKVPPSIASYVFIAEKNIFSPERKEFPLPMASAKKPSVRPQVILYGVTIHEDYRYASVVNPGRPLKKGEREMITLKQGEQIGEYRLAEILSDRIRLEASGDSFEVLLYDPATPKRRSDTKTASRKPPSVISTVPVPASASTEAPRPIPPPYPSPVPVEKPKEPSQEAVSTPPVVSPPVTQTPSSPYPSRSRRLPYPPVRPPLQQGGS